MFRISGINANQCPPVIAGDLLGQDAVTTSINTVQDAPFRRDF